MSRPKDWPYLFSRRHFLKGMSWAPVLFLPASIRALPFGATAAAAQSNLPLADVRLIPHYPTKYPLDDILRLADPGSDEYVTEGYASEIGDLLARWSQRLRADPRAAATLSVFVESSVQFTSLVPVRESPVRSGGIDVARREFSPALLSGRERFLQEIEGYLAPFDRVDVADFEIYECTEVGHSPVTVEATIRYDFVGTRSNPTREERVGDWRTRWLRNETGEWRLHKWSAAAETVSRAQEPAFVDITSHAMAHTESYRRQMLHGSDYWRTVLDGAIGVDVYGNNGLAVGDFDNDGFDDLYVCQPSGLPNRLYRNRGDGTFEDVTEKAGVGVLDNTACALFADFRNIGLQDLLVVCGSGPLLFLNQGDGRFLLKPDAFKFARPPQGTFTHAALADYDRDGRLDIYFCLYTYYLGLDQYHYPVPYFDARNGPPNFLFHNEGNGVFQDRTVAAGLNIENDRYSFACTWGASNADGWPDLYVVNDFGRNNLYRNNGDGTFATVSSQSHVDEPGAGMSACWLDFDNDGRQDIYSAGMWVAAGMRVFGQPHFHEKDPESIRASYRRHMAGNLLYRNQGKGQFQNVAARTGVEMGRWSWSSDAWDFDHDGYSDLYVANGYLTGAGPRDVSSFFWRQVVAKSPQNSVPSPAYERGWSAINELVRSDASWNGRERNNFFANNRDGTFSDISGVAGLDFREDSRAFALADFDGDGKLEVVLKNRNAPQLRILRVAMNDVGNAISFRLRGTTSNRDAIGAAATVTAGTLKQTRYLHAGSGFLSQHTKELFFGVGKAEEGVTASIRWPSGFTQTLSGLPVNHRIEIEEGVAEFRTKPYSAPPVAWTRPGDFAEGEKLPSSAETWLIQPLRAPDFSLPDLDSSATELRSFRGGFVLLNLWMTTAPACRDELRHLQQHQSEFRSAGLKVVTVNLDDPSDASSTRSFVGQEGLSFTVLLGTRDIAGVYNIIYRYLFDRRRDLPIPVSFLIDGDGMIIKIYQGRLRPEQVLDDLRSVPRTPADRIRKALPFDGTLYQGAFQRNNFTYGVALFQFGYLEQAAASFQQAIVDKPEDPEAHYNLGTLYLRRNALPDARLSLERAVQLRANYPEAWNNLGMLAAQEGHSDEAIRNFQQALALRPDYAIALINLGNFYRRQGNVEQAERMLSHALQVEPENAEANYGMGMTYSRLDQLQLAVDYLERSVKSRPDYLEALNNLGILLVRQQRYSEAEQKFQTCILKAPDFDQAYLNLARLYVLSDDKERARGALRALLRLQPQHKMAQQALEMLQ